MRATSLRRDMRARRGPQDADAKASLLAQLTSDNAALVSAARVPRQRGARPWGRRACDGVIRACVTGAWRRATAGCGRPQGSCGRRAGPVRRVPELIGDGSIRPVARACDVAPSTGCWHRDARRAQHMVEEVLVSLLGHWSSKPRNRAIRLLTMLYDAGEWQVCSACGWCSRGGDKSKCAFANACDSAPQMDGALPCTIGCVGDAFDVAAVIREEYVLPGMAAAFAPLRGWG